MSKAVPDRLEACLVVVEVGQKWTAGHQRVEVVEQKWTTGCEQKALEQQRRIGHELAEIHKRLNSLCSVQVQIP